MLPSSAESLHADEVIVVFRSLVFKEPYLYDVVIWNIEKDFSRMFRFDVREGLSSWNDTVYSE
jgi:hypothetical protein